MTKEEFSQFTLDYNKQYCGPYQEGAILRFHNFVIDNFYKSGDQ